MSSAAFLKDFMPQFLPLDRYHVYIHYSDELLVVAMLFASGKNHLPKTAATN